jgi:prepilin-type N-terminal cleavage/methylation domain-containing protein
MKRIKAFTLVEMLLVLVLSAIVVAVAYSVYSQLHLFGMEYEKRNGDALELLTFDQHVRFDARKATDIRMEGDGFVFVQAPAEDFATYARNPAGVRRTISGSRDNFNVVVQAIRIDSSAFVKTLVLAVGAEPDQADTLSYTIQLPASARAPR